MEAIKFLIAISLVLFGVVKCYNSEWNQNQLRNQHEEAVRRQTPHVIREADGCKVYAFESGANWHYFTRCGSTVTTDRTYQQSCGKNCTKTMTESIATEGE